MDFHLQKLVIFACLLIPKYLFKNQIMIAPIPPFNITINTLIISNTFNFQNFLEPVIYDLC
jgi:hypothetical protein